MHVGVQGSVLVLPIPDLVQSVQHHPLWLPGRPAFVVIWYAQISAGIRKGSLPSLCLVAKSGRRWVRYMLMYLFIQSSNWAATLCVLEEKRILRLHLCYQGAHCLKELLTSKHDIASVPKEITCAPQESISSEDEWSGFSTESPVLQKIPQSKPGQWSL